jgi:hypothetical protein
VILYSIDDMTVDSVFIDDDDDDDVIVIDDFDSMEVLCLLLF